MILHVHILINTGVATVIGNPSNHWTVSFFVPNQATVITCTEIHVICICVYKFDKLERGVS